MSDLQLLSAILDSFGTPVLYVDTNHLIRYMNKAAREHYQEGESLLGRSVLDCHNPKSRTTILQVLEALHAGETERLITDGPTQRIYMRAVRDSVGNLLGYYERYEPIQPRTAGPEAAS